MIAHSVPLMTAIDLFVLGVAIYMVVLYLRHRRDVRRLGLAVGLGAVLVGVGLLACLYALDLYATHVRPALSGEDEVLLQTGMLHLEWSWIAALLSSAAFAFGFHELVGGLVPRLVSTIDELREAERGLRESKARLEREVEERTAALTQAGREFRGFLDNSPDACHFKDADGRYLFVSRTYGEWLGVEAGVIVGEGFGRFIEEPDLVDRARELDQRILDGEASLNETMVLKVPGRPPRTIEVRKFPVADESGAVTLIGTISRDVTDAVASEKARAESEARYALATAASTSGIWDWELGSGRIHYSPRLLELLAFSERRAAPTPEAVIEVIHVDDRQRYLATLKAHLDGETPVFACEFRVVGDDGRERHVVNRGIAQRDESGRVTRMAGAVLDVTEEVVQRERTREAERRLALALAHIQDGLALFDADDRLVIGNDTWRYGLNHAVAELLEPGVNFETYVRALLEKGLMPEAIGREQAWLEERLRGRRSGHNVVEIRMADDTWQMITETVVEDGSLVLVATPITALKRREMALEQSEQRFRDFTEASSDWYWEMDADVRFTYISGGFETSLGESPELVLGRRRQDLSGAASARDGWQRHLADLEARRPFRGFEYSVEPRPGKVLYVSISGVPVHDVEGNFIGYRGVGTDVTAQRNAQAEVRRLNRELEARVQARTAALRETMAELESFSYSVSHDLRAPLRHVAGYIDLLERHAGSALDDKASRYLRVIHEAAERMGELIDDLLQLSHTGRTAMSRAAVDLAEIVDEIRRETPVDSECEIRWQIADLPPINADRGLMRRVMANLIGNAVKFTRTRSPAIIEIGWQPAADDPAQVVYFVRDNGVGYDERYRDKLFGVFQRLHAQAEFEGTGIGLAIVHRVISRHGGRIWSSSELDKGASFYFTVPEQGDRDL